MKDFLNRESMYECIKTIYEEAIDNAEDHEDLIEDMAYNVAESTADDIRKYVHMKDTRIMGNFNNIRSDWDYHKESFWVARDENSKAVEVKPFCTFDDMVKGMDEDTLSDEQVWMVQQWCEGWFFETFGTYNLKYNFQTMVAEIEYEDKECA